MVENVLLGSVDEDGPVIARNSGTACPGGVMMELNKGSRVAVLPSTLYGCRSSCGPESYPGPGASVSQY